jgi:hypothetical protein
MAVAIFIALRVLLERIDVAVIHYQYRRPDGVHVITAQRWEGGADGSPPCLSQQMVVTDECLERIVPEAGVRMLTKQATALLSEAEFAKDA